MVASEEKTTHTEIEDTDTTTAKDYDIIRILDRSGHHTLKKENGISIGIRFSGIPDTRGVHVEVVHVLDLRSAKFGKSPAGMKSHVLDVINRPLESIMNELSLNDQLVEKSIRTVWGKIPLRLLAPSKAALKKNKTSLIHETRTVYVVTNDVRPSYDLSWITEGNRILSINEFAIARSSDARSRLPELKQGIDTEKWDSLQKATLMSFYSLLGISLTLLATISILFAILEQSWLIPIAGITLLASVILTAYFSYISKRQIEIFKESREAESMQLSGIGDLKRIEETVHQNKEQLNVINELNFVIPTLFGASVESISNGDVNESVHYASIVLDECVRLSPGLHPPKDTPFTADKGLSKFLGLFQFLEVNFEDGEEESLALAYSALTGHTEAALSGDEVVTHLTSLSLVLFNSGVLSPQVKDTVDDVLNNWSMHHVSEELTDALAESIPEAEYSPTVEEPDPESDEEIKGEYDSVLQDLTDSNEEDGLEEISIIADSTQDVVRTSEDTTSESTPREPETIPRRHRKARETIQTDLIADDVIKMKTEIHLQEIKDKVEKSEEE